MRYIPYGRQDINEQDIARVAEVLRSDWVTQGPVIEQFESAVAGYCQVPHAIAVNSATSGLHTLCMALDIGPGKMVWTSPNTFVASANCALYCGADVDFVDIDPRSYNLCPLALESKLQRTRSLGGRLPDLVIAVHFAGQSCDMRALAKLAEDYGFRLVEDASHAIGARYRGRPVGNCDYSDACVFSFHPVKIITTGEGGMITTPSAELAERMQRLRSHGIVRSGLNQVQSPGAGQDLYPPAPWMYEQHELGCNYRLTDIQAALGLSQLSRLDQYVARRTELAGRYDRLLQGHDLILPWQSCETQSSWHLYSVQIPVVRDAGAERLDVFNAMRSAGIGVNVHYIPVHTQPFYLQRGHAWGDHPRCEAYYARAITLPLFPTMTLAEQDHVVEVLLRSVQRVQAA